MTNYVNLVPSLWKLKLCYLNFFVFLFLRNSYEFRYLIDKVTYIFINPGTFDNNSYVPFKCIMMI